MEPLAYRVRPKSLEDFYGQEDIVGKDKLLYRLIKADKLTSAIFWGPPGCGKTSLARIIAKTTKNKFVILNATTAGVSDIKAVVEKAQNIFDNPTGKIILFIDEIHRFNKLQQDALLPHVEKGTVILIGATTENPFFSINKALLSRSTIFKFNELKDEDVFKILKKCIDDKENGLGNYNIEITDDVLKVFAKFSGGDVRTALNSLELAVKSTPSDSTGLVTITPEIIADCTGGRVLSIDEDMYYDMLSAFGKSLRGSDPDGALYWAYRLIESGVDPIVVLRRLIAHTSEDVGLANSNALVVAVSALTAYQNLGIPEGLIPLTHAIICTATSPKSNAVVLARDSAINAVKSTVTDPVPDHLKNYNFLNEKRAKYKYPHDFGGYVKQQYLPDSLEGTKFYNPTDNGNERKIAEFMNAVQELLKEDAKKSKDTFKHGNNKKS